MSISYLNILILIFYSVVTYGQNDNLDDSLRVAIQFDDKFEILNDRFIGKDSLIIEYYSDSENKIKSKIRYAIDKSGEVSCLKHGKSIEFYPNGQIKTIGNFQIDSYIDCGTAGLEREFYNYRIGKWTYYYDNGQINAKGEYKVIDTSIDTRCKGGDSLVFSRITDLWQFFDKHGNYKDFREIDKTKYNCVEINCDKFVFIEYCYDLKLDKVTVELKHN